MSKGKNTAEATQAILAQRFPHCIQAKGLPKKPLKIGIREDMVAATADLNAADVILAVNDYCRGSKYLESLVDGATRVDINGEPSGAVNKAAADVSARRLRERRFVQVLQQDIRRLNTNARSVKDAVRHLYYAAVWSPDRPCDAAALWTAVRDACGFKPGESPKPIAALNDTTILWCCHVRGPDDLMAAPDYAAALALADKLNGLDANREPMLRAVPAPWPHSPESHAEQVKITPSTFVGGFDPAQKVSSEAAE